MKTLADRIRGVVALLGVAALSLKDRSDWREIDHMAVCAECCGLILAGSLVRFVLDPNHSSFLYYCDLCGGAQ